MNEELLRLSLSKTYIENYQLLFNCKLLKRTVKIKDIKLEYKKHLTRELEKTTRMI